MLNPKTCVVRGPLTVCHDQPCFDKCVEYTKNEKEGIIKKYSRTSLNLTCPHKCKKKGKLMRFSNKGMLAWHLKAKHGEIL